MHDRIRFIDHQRQKILCVDFSGCTADEVEEVARQVPDYVMAEPLGSVLVLTTFTNATFDRDAIRAMKETAVFDKPFVKKSALIGLEDVPISFVDDLKKFSRRELLSFDTRKEALDWLTESAQTSKKH
jgi:hypothetical protein